MKQLPFADPGTPDTRSPTRFLLWVGRQQLGTLLLGMTFGIVWMLAQALLPWVLGRAIDDGRRHRATPQALLALGRRACSDSASSRPSPARSGTGSRSATGCRPATG